MSKYETSINSFFEFAVEKYLEYNNGKEDWIYKFHKCWNCFCYGIYNCSCWCPRYPNERGNNKDEFLENEIKKAREIFERKKQLFFELYNYWSQTDLEQKNFIHILEQQCKYSEEANLLIDFLRAENKYEFIEKQSKSELYENCIRILNRRFRKINHCLVKLIIMSYAQNKFDNNEIQRYQYDMVRSYDFCRFFDRCFVLSCSIFRNMINSHKFLFDNISNKNIENFYRLGRHELYDFNELENNILRFENGNNIHPLPPRLHDRDDDNMFFFRNLIYINEYSYFLPSR